MPGTLRFFSELFPSVLVTLVRLRLDEDEDALDEEGRPEATVRFVLAMVVLGLCFVNKKKLNIFQVPILLNFEKDGDS